MHTKFLWLWSRLILVMFGLFFSISACQSAPPPQDDSTATPVPAATPIRIAPSPTKAAIPYALISKDSLLAYLEALTSIQPYSGWRNSASSGEAQALDYVKSQLSGFSYLMSKGMGLERQHFSVYTSTEFWQAGLAVKVNGQTISVPAQGLRASRFDRQAALYLDTDGVFNDSDPDPATATGAPLFVNEDESLFTLAAGQLEGRILFLDFSLIDRYVNSEASTNGAQFKALMDQGLAGVVLVTQYSNQARQSHGTVLGDGSIFQYQVPTRRVPVVSVRLEDLSSAGIASWTDLEKIESATVMLDSDVFSPGQSGNLIARIPGRDATKAVILGAHIDSPNGPGAFDDGSGSAALLEVARVLDAAHIQPSVDVFLAWFGGHEIGTYGSAYFASTHQELLDRSLAMIQMDCLGLPLDEHSSKITMALTSYGRFGDQRLLLPTFLSEAVADQGISLDPLVEYGLIADNSNFDLFNLPNLDLLYLNGAEWRQKGASYIHYSNHFHDPYETVERARQVGDAFVEMTKVMLAAALETGSSQPNLRVPPEPDRRALLVASHTESVSFSTAMLRELGMALAWEGFDVDLIPYGQALSRSDLDKVGIVVLPPTIDYPGPHQEKWSEAELALLDNYVRAGGFLVVTNSAYNYAMKIPLDERNEDARALNDLLEPMGVRFTYGVISEEAVARAVSEHPLTVNATYLTYYSYSSVPFRMIDGLELVRAAGRPIVGLVEVGEQGGQVLVIADLGLLQGDSNGAKNVEFLANIARYARTR